MRVEQKGQEIAPVIVPLGTPNQREHLHKNQNITGAITIPLLLEKESCLRLQVWVLGSHVGNNFQGKSQNIVKLKQFIRNYSVTESKKRNAPTLNIMLAYIGYHG